MGIHQALIGGYLLTEPSNWEVSSLDVGSGSYNISSSNLEANDLIIFALGSDSQSTNLTSSLSTTSVISDDLNSIEVVVRYGVVPATPSNITGNLDCDYGVIMGFRRTGSSSSYNVSTEETNETSSIPSHNNTPVAFVANDLALLLAFIDDEGTPMGAPTDSIKISEDADSGNGSIGAAYKQIDSAGNYSWGSWTTNDTDNTVAFVIKIQEA